RGDVMATSGTGHNPGPLYDAYRPGYVAQGRPAPTADRFAYLGLVAVAANETAARARGEIVASYLRTGAIVHVPFRNPPGFLSVEDNALMLKGQTPPPTLARHRPVAAIRKDSVQDRSDRSAVCARSP